MKRRSIVNTLFVFIFLLAVALSAFGQIDEAAIIDQSRAEKGKNILLEVDKPLLEPGETTRMSIKILVYPTPDPSNETPPLVIPNEVVLSPDSALYSATNWRVVEGGGNLVGIDATTFNYTAPAIKTAAAHATISVDLNPKKPGLPKVTLIATINFDKNDNLVILNVPDVGLNNARFVLTESTAFKAPTMQGVDPRVAANLPPDVLAKMKEAQKKIGQQDMSIGVAATASNAKYMFDPIKEFATYSLVGLNPLGTKQAAGTVGAFNGDQLQFAANGNGSGTHAFAANDTNGLIFHWKPGNLGIGCGELNTDNLKTPCKGAVVIEKEHADYMVGYAYAIVYTARDTKKVSRGKIYVKFKLRRVN